MCQFVISYFFIFFKAFIFLNFAYQRKYLISSKSRSALRALKPLSQPRLPTVKATNMFAFGNI